jgi:tetratricopeptide (TPR) repeat protein
MKLESVIYAIAGVFFGLIAGWIIGSQQALMSPRPIAPVAESAPPSASGSAPGTPEPAILDETQVQALRNVVDRDPKNAVARAQLGNLYYDAGRYTDAIKWYTESLALNPKDVSVSTDLGVSYYYTGQTDRALQQFDVSLKLDPRHTKTLLNQGIVRAFGKQDLAGAAESWQRVVELAPDSPEGQAASRALEGVASAGHPAGGAPAPPAN